MTDPATPAELLADARHLRSLARQLVRDPEVAEDLVQSTWLRAVQHRPKGGRGLRAWLSQVLRNEARQARRQDGRRVERERRVARSEQVPSGEEQLERLAVQRQLLAAVEGLEPIYREVVYLRWFEELAPRAIAARLGLPRKTVETRLTRAHRQLRERLDRGPGGREVWLPALAAVAGPGRFVGLYAIVGEGVALMSTKAWLVTGGAAAAAALILFWSLTPARLDVPDPVVQSTADPAPAAVGEDVGGAEGRAGPRTASAAPQQEAAPEEGERTRWVQGRVFDLGEVPVGDHGLEFRPTFPRGEGESTEVPRARSQADGRFRMAHHGVGGTVVSTEAAFTTVLAGEFRAFDGEVPVVVAPTWSCAGSVVLADGSPVAGVALSLALPEGFRSGFSFGLEYTEVASWKASSDAEGRFVLGLPVLKGGELVVVKDGYREQRLPLEPRQGELRIVLEPVAEATGQLRGVLLDAEGLPMAGASVAMGRRPTRTDSQGAFEFVVQEGDEEIFAVAGGWQPVRRRREEFANGRWPEFLELRLLERPLTIAGRVLTPDGKPHGNAGVWVHDLTFFGMGDENLPMAAESVMHPVELLWRKVSTDADGCFEIPGLVDRAYEVRAVDEETTLVATRSAVRAGTKDLVLQFSADGILPEVVGRVVDRQGQPIADVSLQVERDAYVFRWPEEESQAWLCQARGANAVTDADGVFVLENIPREGIYLHLWGTGLMTDSYRYPDDRVLDSVEIVVTRRCKVRVDMGGSPYADADGARFYDAEGEPVQVERAAARMRWIEKRTALSEGRSELLTVPDSVVEVRVFRGDEELVRLPVAPSPDRELTVGG